MGGVKPNLTRAGDHRAMSIASISGTMATAVAGLSKGTERAHKAAVEIASGNIDAEPVVDLIIAEHEVKANAEVVRTADEMSRTLLDILA